MADETFAPIQKLSPDDMAVKPNLHMSETYEDFSWESMYGELDWLPGGGLNKAHEAIDRHANGKNRDKVAMIWEGKNGEREDYTFGDMKRLTNQFANVCQSLGIEKGDLSLIHI